jgi:tetratricopeptide (TPR) repeat protein
LIAAEAARPTENSDALDCVLRGRAASNRPQSRETYSASIALYERALVLDPQSADTQSALAAALAGRVLNNMTDSATVDFARAEGLTDQALAALPRSPLAHYAKGTLLRAQRRYAAAIPEYETVLASDRNWAYAVFALGQCRLFTGSIEETIPLTERAIRLSPRDPQLGVWYQQIGVVHLLQSRADEAVVWFEKARSHTPASSGIRADLASAYALCGDTKRGAAELAEARRLSPDNRYSSIVLSKALGQVWVPKIRALLEATYFEGLRKAGMPEE